MLLVLLPFVAGVVLCDSVVIPLVWLIVALFVATVGAWLLLPRRVAWCYVAFALLLLGYITAELRRPVASLPYDTDMELIVEVVGEPAQRSGYRVAGGRVEAWREDASWRGADDAVQLWLRSDSVGYGDRLHLRGRVVERMSRYDDYDELLRRRGNVGGVAVGDYNIISIEHCAHQGLQHRALLKLEPYARDSASHATVEAMVVGARHRMPASLREAYSRTGLSHLMAVSGLHLGIVAMVVGVMLLPVVLLHRGHVVRNLLIVVALWLFAAVSGMSPSVVRAAVMLSVLQLSAASSSRYSSINALAATIFLMLVIRPDYLYDISFRLSVAAVAGIGLGGVPLMRHLPVRRGVGGWVPTTIVVGVVATLWTLPLVSHSFATLPIVGVMVTPVVLLPAYIVVGGGILALALPAPLNMPFAVAAEWAAELQNRVVERAAMPEWASLEYAMPEWGVWLCYLLFAIITLVGWSIDRKKTVSLQSYDEYRRG